MQIVQNSVIMNITTTLTIIMPMNGIQLLDQVLDVKMRSQMELSLINSVLGHTAERVGVLDKMSNSGPMTSLHGWITMARQMN
jgi:hypothetical protein